MATTLVKNYTLSIYWPPSVTAHSIDDLQTLRKMMIHLSIRFGEKDLLDSILRKTTSKLCMQRI